MVNWILTSTTTNSATVTSTATVYPLWLNEQTMQTSAANIQSQLYWSSNQNLLVQPRVATWYSGLGQQQHQADPVYRAPRPAIIRERTPEEVVEREAAISRARGLLIGELSRAQRRQFEAKGSFEVRGRRGVYRIRRAVAGNIDVLRPEGGIAHRLCGHPSDLSMPVEDVMLAQLIHLRNDEDGFLRVANRHAAPGLHPGVDAHLAMAERRLAA